MRLSPKIGPGDPRYLAVIEKQFNKRYRASPDRATGATWDESGLALDGPQAGTRLAAIPAYQEFWHSWQDFRPETTARCNPAL